MKNPIDNILFEVRVLVDARKELENTMGFIEQWISAKGGDRDVRELAMRIVKPVDFCARKLKHIEKMFDKAKSQNKHAS